MPFLGPSRYLLEAGRGNRDRTEAAQAKAGVPQGRVVQLMCSADAPEETESSLPSLGPARSSELRLLRARSPPKPSASRCPIPRSNSSIFCFIPDTYENRDADHGCVLG